MAKGEEDEETGRVRKGNHVKRGRVVQKQKQKWVWLLPRQVLLAWSYPGPLHSHPQEARPLHRQEGRG